MSNGKYTDSKTVVHLILKLDVGGLERVMLNCIKQMQLVRPHYKHIVISLTDANGFSQEGFTQELDVICMNKKDGNDWKLHLRLFKLFNELKPDILHTYNLSTIEYHLVGALAGVPVRIHAEHGRDIADPNGLNKKHNFLRKLVSYFVHDYIAVSEELYNWLIDRVGIQKRKARYIPNGIDVSKFEQQRERSATTRFINIARLSPIKDHSNLLKACEILNKTTTKEWSLSVVGDGALKSSLIEESERLGLAEHVSFLGERSDIVELLASHDVFVLSSIAEGIPMTILEAMASSMPIVSTRVGGIPQVVSQGVEGFLVDNKNPEQLAKAMTQFIGKTELIEQCGNNAKEKVESQFSESTMINSYLRCYECMDELGK